ncbi:hypothetical protein GCM10010841_04560 [Deinococcus aerophilus]|uniref:Uncharacterized protein n=1 Tax=Deinococcus aerophilus TaxID=522488 RepID=A0ABQ2GJ78_9DEIO|nr:hypothetical protein GCM10010841_04560 [Deinococcus aerophilus]
MGQRIAGILLLQLAEGRIGKQAVKDSHSTTPLKETGGFAPHGGTAGRARQRRSGRPSLAHHQPCRARAMSFAPARARLGCSGSVMAGVYGGGRPPPPQGVATNK